jgi:hypothetical protein
MTYQTTRTVPTSVPPDSLTGPERAVLFNIETHSNWSDVAVVNALFEKGLITRRSADDFRLTDQGRAMLDRLLQNYRRRR